MDSTGGPVRPLPGVNPRAVFSADGRWIYSASPFTKTQASGDYSRVRTYDFAAANLKVSPDGRFLYFTKPGPPGPGLWRMSLDGEGDPTGDQERVVPGVNTISYAPTDQGVFFMGRCSAGGGETPCLHFLDFGTGEERELLAVRKRIWAGLSARRDGSAVLWAQVDDYTSDLMLVDNFRLQ